MTDRKRDLIRRRLLEIALGEAPPASADELELELDGELSQELRDLRHTVRLLQSSAHLRPSPAFRETLERRLDRIDAHERRAAGAASRWLGRARFRLEFLRYCLRTSPALRWQAASALAMVAIGFALAITPGDESPVPEVSVVPQPDPRDGGTPEVPPTALTEKELVPWEPEEMPAESLQSSGRDEAALVSGRGAGEPELIPEPVDSISQPFNPDRLPDPSKTPDSRSFRTTQEQQPALGNGVLGGLRWLVQQQHEDGSWSPGEGDPDIGVGVTALALMALVSGEEAAGTGTRLDRVSVQEAIIDGVQSLLAAQQNDGCFGRTFDGSSTCFNHVTATLALTEYATLHRLTADSPVRASVEHGLDHLEIQLNRMFLDGGQRRYERDEPPRWGGNDKSFARALGHNAAWAALTLATARASKLNWHLSSPSQRKAEQLLVQLSTRASTDGNQAVAFQHLVTSMNKKLSRSSQQWQTVVEGFLINPAAAEPSLRFLVTSALCPRGGDSSPMWEDAFGEVQRYLLSLQDARRGFFPAPFAGLRFDGGHVYQTALAVLTLQVPVRIQSFEEAVRGK